MATSTVSVGLALLGGVLTILSPCVLPVLPVLVGRSLQSHRYGPVLLVTGFAVAGSLLGFAASWLAGFASLLRQGAIAVLLALRLLTVFPTWSYRLLSYLPVHRWTKVFPRIGLLGEFWLGTQLGLLWTPCAGPALGGILVLAAVNHQVLGAFRLLVAYGIGAGFPLLAIAYGGRACSQHLLNLRAHSAGLQRVGGVMIVLTAIAILQGWDIQVQLWLAPLFPSLPL